MPPVARDEEGGLVLDVRKGRIDRRGGKEQPDDRQMALLAGDEEGGDLLKGT